MEKEFENLDEVVDHLVSGLSKADRESLQTSSPSQLNHFFGMQLRNSLNLWWSTKLRDKVKQSKAPYPQTKPALVKWFNEQGLYHADDMSLAIEEAFTARIRDKEFDIQAIVDRVNKHWKKQGINNPQKEFGSPDE